MENREDRLDKYNSTLELQLKAKLKKIGLSKRYINYSHKYEENWWFYSKIGIAVILFVGAIFLVTDPYIRFENIVNSFFNFASLPIQISKGLSDFILGVFIAYSFIILIIFLSRVGLTSEITMKEYSNVYEVSKYDDYVLSFTKRTVNNAVHIKKYEYKYLKIRRKIDIVQDYHKTLNVKKKIAKDMLE